jgi:hypothetical protein
MLNFSKTQASSEAIRRAASSLGWLEAASDSAHREAILAMVYRAHDLLADLELLAERAGFHPGTGDDDDVDGYDRTDDANVIAESGEADPYY